jgi:hypothetical protein
LLGPTNGRLLFVPGYPWLPASGRHYRKGHRPTVDAYRLIVRWRAKRIDIARRAAIAHRPTVDTHRVGVTSAGLS